MRASSQSQGFSVIEIVIASAIIVTVVSAAAAAWQAYLKISNTAARNTEASLFSVEAAEALHIMRDQSWSSKIVPLALNTAYQLYWNGAQYQATTSQILLQSQFVRTMTLSSIMRDGNSNIVSSGGTVDSNARKINISVFLVGATSSPIMQTEMLLHNIYAN